MKHTLLIFGLLWALGASGQIYIDSYRFGGGAPPATLLLDDYPNAAAAYSLRKLRTAYTGNCIVVRRSSNNDTLAIGFSGNYLDTAALKTFCASTDCFVRHWYDQSGNGLDARQTTNTRQPTIFTSNALTVASTGDVCMFFNAAQNLVVPNSTTSFNFIHNGTTSYVALVGQAGIISNPVANYFFIDNNGGGVGPAGYYVSYFDAGANNNAMYVLGYLGSGSNGYLNIAQNVFNPNQLLLFDEIMDADATPASARSNVKFNAGASITNNTWTGTIGLTNNAGFNMTFGSISTNSSFLRGYIGEILFYSSNQAANRTGIQQNINSFYNVY